MTEYDFSGLDSPPSVEVETAPEHSSPESSGSFDFSGVDALDKKAANEAKYGGALEGAKAFLEGTASSATLGLSRLVETKLLGVDPEAIEGRAQAHPYASTAGEIAGVVAPTVLSGGAFGEASLLAKAARATPIGQVMKAGKAVEGALGAGATARTAGLAAEGAIQAGATQLFSDISSGNPNLDAQKILARTTMSTLTGGALGGALGGSLEAVRGGSSFLKSTIEKLKNGLVDPESAALSRLPGKLGEDLATGAQAAQYSDEAAELSRVTGNKVSGSDKLLKDYVDNLKTAYKEGEHLVNDLDHSNYSMGGDEEADTVFGELRNLGQGAIEEFESAFTTNVKGKRIVDPEKIKAVLIEDPAAQLNPVKAAKLEEKKTILDNYFKTMDDLVDYHSNQEAQASMIESINRIAKSNEQAAKIAKVLKKTSAVAPTEIPLGGLGGAGMLVHLSGLVPDPAIAAIAAAYTGGKRYATEGGVATLGHDAYKTLAASAWAAEHLVKTNLKIDKAARAIFRASPKKKY